MRPPTSWNLGQRIVLVVAAGLTLQTLAHWILYSGSGGGWFGYAPQTVGQVADLSDTRRYGPGTTAILTIGFIVSWTAVSLWLLHDRGGDE